VHKNERRWNGKKIMASINPAKIFAYNNFPIIRTTVNAD